MFVSSPHVDANSSGLNVILSSAAGSCEDSLAPLSNSAARSIIALREMSTETHVKRLYSLCDAPRSLARDVQFHKV
jgi:hypothetical protein